MEPKSDARLAPQPYIGHMKSLVVVLAACGLLLAFQHRAQAQVSWGIPLPFPFLFYNFNGGYQQPQPYYGGHPAYYRQGYYYRPSYCTPSRSAYFYRRYYQPRYYYYYGPAWAPGYYGPGWAGYGGW
jgi:hypothetical protein